MSDMQFQCQWCSGNLVVDDSGAGMTLDCPHCGKSITIPQNAFTPTTTAEKSTGVPTRQLKKCPACAEEILVEAKKCRFCGELLDQQLKTKSEQPPILQSTPQPKKKTGGGGIVLLILLCIGAALYGGWYWINHLTPSADEIQRDTSRTPSTTQGSEYKARMATALDRYQDALTYARANSDSSAAIQAVNARRYEALNAGREYKHFLEAQSNLTGADQRALQDIREVVEMLEK